MMASTMEYLAYCTTTIVLFLSLFYAYAKYKLSYWSKRGVKTPPTHFIFGNFKGPLTLKKAPSQELQDIYNSADPNDPYIGFYIFHKPALLLRDIDLIKHLIIKNFNLFPNRYFGSAEGRDLLGLENLLAVSSLSKWKYMRNKLTPALHGKKLKNMMPLFVEKAESILDYIQTLPPDECNEKTCENIFEIATRYVNDILTSFVFGVKTNSFEKNDTFHQKGLNIFRGFKATCTFLIYFFIPELIPLIEWHVKKSQKFFQECLNDSISAREKLGSKREDLIDFLLMYKNEEQNPDYEFNNNNLLAQAMSLYIAGLEVTAVTIAFAIYELASHAEHQDTLYNEIKTHLSEKEITVETINDMPFLHCFVNETTRLYPGLPFISRTAEEDFELPTGVVIEKGTAVYVSINAINQDPKYFSNPQDFIPTRTITQHKKFHETLAFGAGPRACLGQNVGLLIVKMAIVTIVANYSMSKLEMKTVLDRAHVLSRPYNMNVRFIKRHKNI